MASWHTSNVPETLNLPDLDALDPAALKAIIFHQHAHATVQQERLSSQGSEIERLVMLVAKLNQMLFGRKSEKVLRQIEQIEFQLEALQAASAAERFRRQMPQSGPQR